MTDSEDKASTGAGGGDWRRGLVIVLLASVGLRLIWVVAMPGDVFSADARGWYALSTRMAIFQNPYVTTTLLNWPPFWMVCIWLMQQVADLTGASFYSVLRLLLTAAEGVVIAVLAWELHRRGVRRAAWVAPLAGIALNPVCLLLTLQHGNFDVFVGLWVLLAAIAMDRWLREGEPVAWLWTAAWIGIGIYTKTVPLLLLPFLAVGARRLPASTRWLGLLLAAIPAGVSMSTLYVLHPPAIAANVLEYRGRWGFYGISGILTWLDQQALRNQVAAAFMPAMLVLVTAAGIWLYRRRAEELPSLGVRSAMAGVLLAVPTLGPGYGPQYFWWPWPLLLWLAAENRPIRRAVIGVAAVAVPTYLAEYALIGTLGAFLLALAPSEPMRQAAESLQVQQTAFLVRLPLFAASAVLLAVLGRVAWQQLRPPTGVPPS